MTGMKTLGRRGAALAAALAFLSLAPLVGPRVVTAASERATVSAVVLHVERPGASFSAGAPTLAQARVGQSVRVTLYASISDAARPSTAGVELKVLAGRQPVLLSHGTFSIGRSQMQGSVSGWRWFYNTIRLTRPGRYLVTGSFTMNGVSLARRAVLTVSG